MREGVLKCLCRYYLIKFFLFIERTVLKNFVFLPKVIFVVL